MKSTTKDTAEILRKRAAKYYYKNREKVLAKAKERYKDPNVKKATAKRVRKYRELFPLKNKARRLLQHAIERKGFKKSPCEVCGEIKVEAHHDDYSKPLEVRWLCRTHHAELERKYNIKKLYAN